MPSQPSLLDDEEQDLAEQAPMPAVPPIFAEAPSPSAASSDRPVETGAGQTRSLTPESNAPEDNAPDSNAPQSNAPEDNAPDSNAPQSNAPEDNAPDSNAPQSNATEDNAPGSSATGSNVPDANEATITDAEVRMERRIDHTLGGRTLTYAEMCGCLADEDLNEAELMSHWERLPLAEDS